MSYLLFHFLLILPPIAVMGATMPYSLLQIGGRRAQVSLPLMTVVALSYTTPWDNYLVARKVWWYGSERVLGTIGYVPLEEYLFFLLQPILTGLFLFQYLARCGRPVKKHRSAPAWIGALIFSILSGIGLFLLMNGSNSGLYMGLVLVWACPLLAGMWLYRGERLWRHRMTMLYTVAVPTVYLWIADAIAITTGIWTISDQYTLDVELFNVPIEEATFFLVTNLLVVKGLLLLIDPHSSHKRSSTS